MLFGQHFGRSHKRALVAALDGVQHGRHRHKRLARPHIALQEAVHRDGPGQVEGDLGIGPLLRARQWERQ